MRYPMNPNAYKAALQQFELTQGRAAWLFNGKSNRSGRRWAAEGAPYHVALILAIMQHAKLSPEYIDMLGAPWRPSRMPKTELTPASLAVAPETDPA